MLAGSLEGGSLVGSESVRKLRWKLEEPDQRLIATLCQKLDIPGILATIIFNRGVRSVEEAEFYLDPKLRYLLPNPSSLKDMDRAVLRIISAIQNHEKIVVFGDYDVDGATSTALFKRFFGNLGIEVGIYIPNRLVEGYGPNIEAFKKIHGNGNTLVITVDCGVVSFEPLRFAKEIGLDVIVIDHHLSLESLPEAYAIINPNRLDETFPIKSIAAVGVSFLTVVAIRSKLREIGWFAGKEEVDLMQYLDLVALGTVCDVMPLLGINRAFVTQGLKLISFRKNIGIATLLNVARLNVYPQSHHLGFVLGPRINAGGRVGEGIMGAKLLSTDEPKLAYDIASRLEQLNEERRAIEALVLEEAIAQVETRELNKRNIILVRGQNWHQGVLGILASRIKEKYNRPVAVISVINGVGKGSARSIPGIDLGTLLSIAKEKGLLVQGGGHAMAGGFVLEEEKIDQFYEFIDHNITDGNHFFEKAREYIIDAVVSISAINGKLARVVNRAAPFGNGNPAPKFLIKDVKVLETKIVGKTNLLVIIADDNLGSVKKTLKCISYRACENGFGNVIQNAIGKKVHLVGGIQINIFDESKADFVIEDLSFVT